MKGVTNMARNRFYNAHGIQQGACNIRAIARELVKAADEASADGVQPSEDAAVRLIVHQLAHLTHYGEVNNGFDEVTLKSTWNILMDECEEKGEV
jgi:hypothetical protein